MYTRFGSSQQFWAQIDGVTEGARLSKEMVACFQLKEVPLHQIMDNLFDYRT